MQLANKNEGEEVTRVEMFIKTRQGLKGKVVDEETQNVIVSLYLIKY